MKNLIALPLLALAYMIQTALVSRITLLSGAADLILLIVVAWSLQEQVESAWQWGVMAGLIGAFVSGLPPYVLPAAYLAAVLMARFMLRQTWGTPVLALYSVTFFSTLFLNVVTYIALVLKGTNIPLADVVTIITLPSLFLNFLIALPVHSFIRDLALWVYPVEDRV